MNIQAEDAPAIKEALGLVLPESMKEFIEKLSEDNALALSERVMKEKNSDRVIRCFAEEITQYTIIEAERVFPRIFQTKSPVFFKPNPQEFQNQIPRVQGNQFPRVQGNQFPNSGLEGKV